MKSAKIRDDAGTMATTKRDFSAPPEEKKSTERDDRLGGPRKSMRFVAKPSKKFRALKKKPTRIDNNTSRASDRGLLIDNLE